MKILHIVAGDLSGGAARGAYLLHTGLINQGIDSKIVINGSVGSKRNDILSLSSNKGKYVINKIKSNLDNILASFYRKNGKIFSTGFFGIDFLKLKEYKEADIIHLHWINNGMVKIKSLKKIKKPIVWTIRDMWPMTGGCHYSLSCEKYKKKCGACPQLNSKNNLDLSRLVFNNKKRNIPKKIEIVGISNWITKEAKKSSLLKNLNIRTIHNNINTDEFMPIEKKQARQILQLKTRKKIILTGAQNVNDFYKGFDKFLSAITELNEKDYFICTFGNIDENLLKKTKFEFKNFGIMRDIISLRTVYSAADVFIAPSIQEAFGKTIAEAMSCKTPVVCFDATGPKDIVIHKINGYKARPFDPIDLATGINWIVNNNNYRKIRFNARKMIKEKFDISIISKKYIELYNDIKH